MQAALSGYAVIWSVIAVGFICAHFHVLNDTHRELLSNIAFLLASPFLMFSIVAKASLAHLFAEPLLVSAAAIVAAAGTYLLVARRLFPHKAPGAVIGALCSAYTNAGNLGLPIAALILGDITWMAPILLIQLCVLQPTAIAILDLTVPNQKMSGDDPPAPRGDSLSTPADVATVTQLAQPKLGHVKRPWWYYPTLPFHSPLTIGAFAGLAVNLCGVTFPDLVWQPITMIGDIAVPAMLLAFGISLRLDPPPGRGPHVRELIGVVAIKTVWQPLVAWLLAALVLHLPGTDVLAVTIIAALPTAQNVYLFASRYHTQPLLARDAIFCSTIVSVPVILAASALLA